jgi:hypothetical protein
VIGSQLMRIPITTSGDRQPAKAGRENRA